MKKIKMSKEKGFSKFKKERKEFKEGKRIDINEIQVNETIEFVILNNGYKPTEKEIKEMATKIKSLKGQILLYDQLCDEIEQEMEKLKQKISGGK